MKQQMNTFAFAAALLAAAVGLRAAQEKTVPQESITASATIEAIDQPARSLTIRNEDGTHEVLRVPPEVNRFSELKVGDKITARYQGSMVVRLKKPGEAAVAVESGAIAPAEGTSPGISVATERTMTVTIVDIDEAAPSITVKGPNGWTYNRRVTDRKALAQVKVGDRLDITWHDAVLLSVTPPK